jgi:hypothetical protein
MELSRLYLHNGMVIHKECINGLDLRFSCLDLRNRVPRLS